MRHVTADLATVLASADARRLGLTLLDGWAIQLLNLPTTLPGGPRRWRFECPGCGRNCTLLRRPAHTVGGHGSVPSQNPWRCRLCLPEPRHRPTRRKERQQRAEKALEALRQIPARRQCYEHWKVWRARLKAENEAMAVLVAEAPALAASFRRGEG